MEDTLRELAHSSIECLVTVNLIGSVIQRYPEEVQENFKEKVMQLTANIERETQEFQAFAEAFDDHIDQGD